MSKGIGKTVREKIYDIIICYLYKFGMEFQNRSGKAIYSFQTKIIKETYKVSFKIKQNKKYNRYAH